VAAPNRTSYDEQLLIVAGWLQEEQLVAGGTAGSAIDVTTLEKGTGELADYAFKSNEACIPVVGMAAKECHDFVEAHNRFNATYGMTRANYYEQAASASGEYVKNINQLDYQQRAITKWLEGAA
jgi:hypothetical protein